MKDREFGTSAFPTVYFKDGTFVDQYDDDERVSKIRNIFND